MIKIKNTINNAIATLITTLMITTFISAMFTSNSAQAGDHFKNEGKLCGDTVTNFTELCLARGGGDFFLVKM